MLHFIKSIIQSIGYSGIALLMILENIFPPVPSEIIMPFAGFLSGEGNLSLWAVIASGTIGSVAGTIPFYFVGYAIGKDRLMRWADKHGHWLMLSSEDIKRAQEWFNRHGKSAVLFGRLVPAVRTLISIPAGVNQMNFMTYLLLTLIGTSVWTGFLAYLGYLLGSNFQAVDKYMNPVSYVVIGGLIIWYVVYIVKRKRAQKS